MKKIQSIAAVVASFIGVHSISHAQTSAQVEEISNLLETRSCEACDLEGADLQGAMLAGARLSGANLDGANLSGARLSDADLGGASLVGADLKGAILNRANLGDANLSNADLSASRLIETVMHGANLTNADFRWAKFRDTDIRRATIIGADLTNADVPNWRDDGAIFCRTIEPNGTSIDRDCTSARIEVAEPRLATGTGVDVEQERLAEVSSQSVEPNYDGLYKPRGDRFTHWDCRAVGQDGGALSINGNKLTLIEETCTLSNPTEVPGSPATLFDAHCAVEGTEYDMQISLMKTDFGITFSGEGFSAEWQNCPLQTEAEVTQPSGSSSGSLHTQSNEMNEEDEGQETIAREATEELLFAMAKKVLEREITPPLWSSILGAASGQDVGIGDAVQVAKVLENKKNDGITVDLISPCLRASESSSARFALVSQSILSSGFEGKQFSDWARTDLELVAEANEADILDDPYIFLVYGFIDILTCIDRY